jgi:pimeloyl-ACP methyl ester carboxylesterase
MTFARARRLGLASAAIICGVVLAGWLVLAWVFDDQPVPRAASGDRFVNAAGLRVRYRVSGSGEATVILLHGFGGRMESWGRVPDAIGCAHVVAFDLPGFGASARPDVSYDLESQRRRVVAAMDSLGIGRAVFAGASMGGAVAALLAARSPGRVSALALFAPSGIMGELRLPGAAGWIQSSPVVRAVARTIARVPGYGLLFPQSLARQSLTLTASYDEGYVAALDSVRVPTVVVWSSGDTRVPMAASRTYLAHIRGSRLVAAPVAVGHDLLGDAPMAAGAICDLVGQTRREPP